MYSKHTVKNVRPSAVRPPDIVQSSRLFWLPAELLNLIWSFVSDFDANGHPTNVVDFAIAHDYNANTGCFGR